VAVPSTNSLLITEAASAVREMIGLQELIDVPPPEVQAHFVTLLRANADRVLETINKVTGQGPDATAPTDGAPRSRTRLFASMGKTAPVEFASDTRTNRIVVVCPPSAFPYYESFVRSFDTAAEVAPSFEFQLHYVAVGEILPAIAKALREGQPKDKDSTADSENLEGMQQSGSASNQSASMGSSGGEGTNVLGTVQEQTDRNLPLTVIVGNTRLIADQRNNTIIALAPPESIDRIAAIVEHLDKPPMQVYLSIVIIEMDVTNSLEYGVDFLLRGNEGVIGSNQNIRGNTPTLGQLLNPGDLINPSNIIGTTSGLTMFGTFGTALDVLVSALEASGKVKVLGRPTVYTSNNKKAVISVGEEIPVPQTTVSTVNPNANNSTALTSTIQYKDVLLQLEVVPLVNSNEEVTLEIAQRNDELGNSFEIAGSQVQSVRTQQIKTSVTVPNKNTVVLGGLITEREERTRNQIPVLGDIPLVGLAFSGTRTRNTRKELLLLIQPQIIQGERELFNVNALERRRLRSVDERTDAFIDPELPPYSDLPPEAELVPFPAPQPPTVLPALPANTR
jgi:type II secretion system protein D